MDSSQEQNALFQYLMKRISELEFRVGYLDSICRDKIGDSKVIDDVPVMIVADSDDGTSGGGGGTTGKSGNYFFLSKIEIENPSSASAALVLKGFKGSFTDGVLKVVGSEETISTIPLAKHSEE